MFRVWNATFTCIEYYNFLCCFTAVFQSDSIGFLMLWIGVFATFVLAGVSRA
jgi:hypothetical protein